MKKMLKQGNTPYLPDEIITHILKRLPVKTLIRFQSVSKHWKFLVKSQSFIKDHLHHSNNQNPRVLYTMLVGGNGLFELSVVDPHTEALVGFRIPSLLDNLFDAWIIGSCNGLICVGYDSHRSFLLSNPATREERLLPKAIDCNLDDSFYLGFGFCHILNDYMIVKFHISYVKNWVEVYSLNTDSWREIKLLEDIEVARIVIASHAFINGSIFWHVKNKDKGLSEIVSLDLVTEVFTIIPLPTLDFNRPFMMGGDRVFEHNTNLVLVRCDWSKRYEHKFHFWVMEECVDTSGKKWNWTKIGSSNNPYFSLGKIVTRRPFIYVESLVPIGKMNIVEPRS